MPPQLRSLPIVQRKKERPLRDPSRVITRLHVPDNTQRIAKIIQRVVDLPDREVNNLLAQILLDFSNRHKDIRRVFDRHLNEVKAYVPDNTA